MATCVYIEDASEVGLVVNGGSKIKQKSFAHQSFWSVKMRAFKA
jgi:hypothetical protein